MSRSTILTTASGRMIDLLNPKVSDIHFPDIVEHLAKANRYCGATPERTYSVAEHSVRCVRAAQYYASVDAAAVDVLVPAYALCHDMHEAYLGDDTTPKKRALAAVAGKFGVLRETIERAFDEIVDNFDVAIHAAAGLTWPPPAHIAEMVKEIDRRMLATEWTAFMPFAAPFPLAEPFTAAAHGSFTPRGMNVPWRTAASEMLRECDILLPSFQRAA